MTSVPLVPKSDDGILRVLMVGRVSTEQQPLSNIEAGYEYAKRHLNYHGKTLIKQLGEQGSGMLTHRATILEAIKEIETGNWDVVLMEDVSKPYRNPRWIYAFVQDAFDAGVSVIAPGDNLDTAEENWEQALGSAAYRHGMHVPDTRRRVRRTAVHSFKAGGMVTSYRFGHRKLTKEEANSGQFGPRGLRLAKVPEATPIIRELRDRILHGDSCTALAQWLEDEGIKPGPYVRKGKWTARLVESLLRAPILSGTRRFRDVIYEPVFKTGKYRRRRNPEPETESYAELAHLTREEHQEVVDCLDGRRRNPGAPRGKAHPLYNRPRSRSFWPGQHARCVWCGGLMHRCGTYLKCQNALPEGPEVCANHVQVPFKQVRDKIIPWVLGILGQYPEYERHVIQSAWGECQRLQRRGQNTCKDVEKEIAGLKDQGKKLAKAIARLGNIPLLLEEMTAVQGALTAAEQKHARLSKAKVDDAPVFEGSADVANRLGEVLDHLALTSLDFADVLRRLLPVFEIQPVQALDTGLVRPRARLTLSLAAWCQGGEAPPESSIEIDLFDPPEHIKHLQRCVDAKGADPDATYRQIAADLKIGYMTVKRALAYAKLMAKEGLTTPYRTLTAPPASASRWKKRPRRRKDSA
jgi:site-specific DNA recombinase